MAYQNSTTSKKYQLIPILLLLGIYLLILFELVLTDDVIWIRYLHFGYLGLFVTSIALFVYFILSTSVLTLWFLPAFLFVSFQYLSPFSLFKTATKVPVVENKQHYQFLSYSVNSRNKDYQQVAELIKQNPADVVCLQEVPFERYELLQQSMHKEGINYHHVYSKIRSLMILSKHPVIPKKTLPYLQADITIEGKHLRVWNVHSPKSLTEEHNQTFYFGKLKEDVEADKSPYKLICGDFNSTPHNEVVKQFEQSFQAAYRYSTQPVEFTYPTSNGVVPSPVPFLKIDYLLFSDNFVIDRYQRLEQYANSDHYPILATAQFQVK